MTELFDYAFAGAGLAGLSLARALVESDLPPGRVLMIDRGREPVDRTIGAWFDELPTWLAEVIEHEWPTLTVADRAGERDLELALRYHALRSGRFHQHVRARLERGGWSLAWLHGEVEALESIADTVHVRVRGEPEPLRARWAFDSRVAVEQPPSWQSFVAARIEVDRDTFDPGRALFMDLRLEQPKIGLEFGHRLAFGPREALIYRVHVGPTRRVDLTVDELLGTIPESRIVAREHGWLPLDARPPTRRPSRRVLRIGVAGGRLDPGTGYAFARMQLDAAAIVDSLVRRGHPFALPRERRVFRWLDGMLLSVIARRPDLARRMFDAMLRPGHDARLFRLLDERASWLDLLGLMVAMPARLQLAGEGLRYWASSTSRS
jgi:lycopene beta-cyclase